MKLHLGCGNRIVPGYVNVDYNPDVMPDVVHDLTVYPWPFEDNQFDEVISFHVIEHLIHQGNAEEFFAFFRECWRVMKDKATIRIITPDASSENAFADPWHKCAFNRGIFAFISKDSIRKNQECNSTMTSVKIDFDFALCALDVTNGDIHMDAMAVKNG